MYIDDEWVILQDVIKTDLKVVLCGLAVGKESARQECYYADKRNKFWETIFLTKIINKQIASKDYLKILEYSVGLTDLVKDQSGGEAIISVTQKHRDDLKQKILKYKPQIIAFNGKKVAMEYLKNKDVPYGILKEKIGDTAIYVLPSTSSMANGFWDDKYWKDLGNLINSL